MDLNEATLIGRLTREPAIRQTQSGKKVASFAVATSRKWKGQNGDVKETTQFHNVVVWGALADIAEKFLHKGSQVWLRGEITYRTYQGKDGQDRYITEINAGEMILLAQPKGSQGQGQAQGAPQRPQAEPLYTRQERPKASEAVKTKAQDSFADDFPLDFSELDDGSDVNIPF